MNGMPSSSKLVGSVDPHPFPTLFFKQTQEGQLGERSSPCILDQWTLIPSALHFGSGPGVKAGETPSHRSDSSGQQRDRKIFYRRAACQVQFLALSFATSFTISGSTLGPLDTLGIFVNQKYRDYRREDTSPSNAGASPISGNTFSTNEGWCEADCVGSNVIVR